MARKPFVAGQFYSASFDELNKEIEDTFYSKFGPGDLPIKRTMNRLNAIIVPHAGYVFSGPCAAWAYKEIAESRFPYSFFIIGPNHQRTGSGLCSMDWETPLGTVSADTQLIKEMSEKTSLKIRDDIHMEEHSIEVQLPFLQFANRDRVKDIKIIPALIDNDLDFVELAKELNAFFAKCGRTIVMIVSSDFTHYGRNYGFMPFTTDIKERINALDKEAIRLILSLDTKGFKDYINKTGITICGFMPILLYLSMLNAQVEKPNTELLIHYLSGDLVKDYKTSVSYASIAFKPQ